MGILGRAGLPGTGGSRTTPRRGMNYRVAKSDHAVAVFRIATTGPIASTLNVEKGLEWRPIETN